MKYHLPDRKYTPRTDRTEFIVIHCADTPNAVSHEFTAAEVRRWHTEERGWLDIGYHFFIREDGTLELGRPVWAVGAHVAGHNTNSVGICMAGGFDGKNDFTPEQWRTLDSVVGLLKAIYPQAEVLGHRDFPGVTKSCPSFDARAWYRANF